MVDSLATPSPAIRPRRLRYYCCTAANSLLLLFFFSLSLPSLHSYFPSPDSDTLDFSRSRDLFEESRESFDASAYDGREFPFGGRTIPVKNCSRNAEAVIPAIFIPFPFVPRVYASACVHFFFFFRDSSYIERKHAWRFWNWISSISYYLSLISNLGERVILTKHRGKGRVNIYEQRVSSFTPNRPR